MATDIFSCKICTLPYDTYAEHVAADLRNLIRVWRNYPELAGSLESIRFHYRHVPDPDLLQCIFEMMLLQRMVRLLQTTSDILRVKHIGPRYYVISPRVVTGAVDITVWAITKEVFARITDEQYLYKENCHICRTRGISDPCTSASHYDICMIRNDDDAWRSASEIASAISNTKACQSQHPTEQLSERDPEARWKVVFHPREYTSSWKHAIKDLEKAKMFSGQTKLKA